MTIMSRAISILSLLLPLTLAVALPVEADDDRGKGDDRGKSRDALSQFSMRDHSPMTKTGPLSRAHWAQKTRYSAHLEAHVRWCRATSVTEADLVANE